MFGEDALPRPYPAKKLSDGCDTAMRLNAANVSVSEDPRLLVRVGEDSLNPTCDEATRSRNAPPDEFEQKLPERKVILLRHIRRAIKPRVSNDRGAGRGEVAKSSPGTI